MIYDVSVPISNELPVYPGDPDIEITPDTSIASGDSANVSRLSFGSHTGTHIDAPYHMIEGGTTVDKISLDALIGPCMVCDVGETPAVRVDDLQALPDGVVRVLLKTRNSRLWSEDGFHTDFTYLDPEAADWLVRRKVRLVGIDYLSIDHFHSGTHPSHLKLLGAGVVIVEGLNLSDVLQGIYTLACLPLRISGGDGSPCRAVLIGDG